MKVLEFGKKGLPTEGGKASELWKSEKLSRHQTEKIEKKNLEISPFGTNRREKRDSGLFDEKKEELLKPVISRERRRRTKVNPIERFTTR